MKITHVLCAAILSFSASAVNAATMFLPTDGDINFVLETGDLTGFTLAIFDEEADIGVGSMLEVTAPELIFWDGVDTLSGSNGSLTIDGDFVLAVMCPLCGSWTAGTIDYSSMFTVPAANAYAVTFGSIAGFELVVDVQPVPVPAAAWLFGSGLIGMIGIARRRA